MPDYTFNVFRRVDIGGTDGLELAGEVTIRDDDGNRDDILDDIEQAGSGETNGDQEVIASDFAELDVGDTFRARGIFRFTNQDTGETYDVREVFSQTAGNPIEQLFIFTSPPPDWLFDDTARSFSLLNSDGTLPYSSIACFGTGTLIRRDDGKDVRIEEIDIGDAILSQDGSVHPVRWIGSRHVSAPELLTNPKLRPIRIAAGALGRGLPTQDLIVSRQHRILVQSAIALRIFGTYEVLVPAHKLLDIEGVEIANDVNEVAYYHILFDQHRILISNGAMTESLFTGPEALRTVSEQARTEITMLFPELSEPEYEAVPGAFIPSTGKGVKKLVARHLKNNKPLLSLDPR